MTELVTTALLMTLSSLLSFGPSPQEPDKTQLGRARRQRQGDFEQPSDFGHSQFGKKGFKSPFSWLRLRRIEASPYNDN